MSLVCLFLFIVFLLYPSPLSPLSSSSFSHSDDVLFHLFSFSSISDCYKFPQSILDGLLFFTIPVNQPNIIQFCPSILMEMTSKYMCSLCVHLIHVEEIVIYDSFMEVERCFGIFCNQQSFNFPGIKMLLYYRLISVSSLSFSVSLFSFSLLLSSLLPSPPSLPFSQKRCCFIVYPPLPVTSQQILDKRRLLFSLFL